ncbi:solute carrier family 13 member 5 [Aplysia californica]|uniref:Solute carrier family 13 member 5 n=1 Tax=Aplysia californica TaxID=6500 RepID=A0ABM1A7G1_APLCA|nr:solute carrier family 13 member 5 [Aplysia californica]
MGRGSDSLLTHVWAWRTVLILVLTPILLLPLPLVVDSSEARCAYVVLLMGVYWITESLPVGVTALIPVLLFPTMGIAGTDAVTGKYFNNVNMLFIAGLMMAVGIEYWNLHRRIALRILLFVGSEPRWLMAGMMIATWFLSMWISNTATTAMMVPITEAILVQLKGARNTKPSARSKSINGDIDMEKTTELDDVSISIKPRPVAEENHVDEKTEYEPEEEDDPTFTRMCKGMSLCICYAANSGGIASLTGTGPNLVLKGEADALYQKIGRSNPVTFGSWMGFGLPLSIVVVIVCWLWLQIVYLRCSGACSCCGKEGQDQDQKARVKAVIQNEYNKLGPIVFGQGMIMFLFVLLVTLWITRDLGGVVGWGHLFTLKVKDSVPAVLVAIMLFALPSTLPFLKSYSNPSHPETDQSNTLKDGSKSPIKDGPLVIRPLLNWKVVHERLPWSLFLLLGGGFALSLGCQESGLSKWIGVQLGFFSSWNQYLMLMMVCYITAAATEVTSNTAISQLLMPIVSQLAIDTNHHPLYYMFPVALSCSFAFMLPVATPPNAIVFAYGRIKISDMVKAGFVMNILAVPILVGMTATVGDAIFDFSNIPPEFYNITLSGVISDH